MFSRLLICEFIKFNCFKGRQKAFNFTDEALEEYINWAFNNNYLFAISENEKITAVLVVYPLEKEPQKILDLLPSDGNKKENNICLMDFIANTKISRQKMTQLFMKTHPNWKNQNKWAIRNDKIVSLSNQYIELVGGTL
jgi:hypothetical protein